MKRAPFLKKKTIFTARSRCQRQEEGGFSWLFEQRACVQTDQGVNAEGSRCAFKTVCPALFMLLRIDNTVSPGEARRVFFFSQPFSFGCPQGE